MGWGLGFVFGSWATLLTTNNPNLVSYAITLFITVWGVRLSARLIKRNWGRPEDFRYAQWRKEWGKKVVITAFFRVFLVQGIINFIVGSASYATIKYNSIVFDDLISIVMVLGLVIAFVGLACKFTGYEQFR